MEETIKKRLEINKFALRQIAINDRSKFGGFTGSVETLKGLILDIIGPMSLSKGIEIIRFYTDDQRFKNLNGKFLCTHAEIMPGETVEEIYEARRPGEQPVAVKQIHRSKKAEAMTVDFILYSHETLAAEGAADSDAEYELISINCMPYHIKEDKEEPMNPATLWRNYLSKIPNCPAGIGGTYRKEWDDPRHWEFDLKTSEGYWKNLARVVVD